MDRCIGRKGIDRIRREREWRIHMKDLELDLGNLKNRGHHSLGRRTQLLKVVSLSVDKVARVVVLGVSNGAIALKEGCCWIASFPERLFLFCFVF